MLSDSNVTMSSAVASPNTSQAFFAMSNVRPSCDIVASVAFFPIASASVTALA